MTTTLKAKRRVSYDCSKCPAYCCSIYERVEVTPRDMRRLARHFGLTLEAAEERFTKRYSGERILRRQSDPVLGRVCRFLDLTTRGCTIYEARPEVCRDYPGKPRCGYYDVLQFERETQDDPNVMPLVQITFRSRTPSG
ncbi:YkgJ family cysteine cluster protein [Sorangium sp. So ce590]|uniref:YkgJ family cysteine cluster protein n=1 Tax=unclassified Sorangium TaxID=2621164 RepID=UPI003F5DD0FC